MVYTFKTNQILEFFGLKLIKNKTINFISAKL